jgi:hypothetical protein
MTPQKREDDLKKDQPLEGFYDVGKYTLLRGRLFPACDDAEKLNKRVDDRIEA